MELCLHTAVQHPTDLQYLFLTISRLTFNNVDNHCFNAYSATHIYIHMMMSVVNNGKINMVLIHFLIHYF